MGGRKDADDADRFLLTKRDFYYYQRRIPKAVRALDTRSEVIRIALLTKSISEARKRRDQYELADNELWASLLHGSNKEAAEARYKAAVARAQALGFSYKTPQELLAEPVDMVLRRINAMPEDAPSMEAMLGTVPAPVVRVTDAKRTYFEEIATGEIRGKSENQRRKWRNVKERGIDLFVRINGDLDMEEINREHALALWRWWQAKIAPAKGAPTHTPSIGNRDLGAMRTLYGDYYKHIGQMDRPNPFVGLSFKEKDAHKRIRPSFPTEWIRDKLMKPGALASMNETARAIIFALIETGARPSEICNLRPEQIVLNHPIPHLALEPRTDLEDPRELKSGQSERMIPLVGVALEVFQSFPNGFPRYAESEESLSATCNKFLRENGLSPTPKHTIYGLRHSFEDRMKEAGIGDELRRIIMGHKIDREIYGIGGSLAWRKSELEKIALPFTPGIVADGHGLTP